MLRKLSLVLFIAVLGALLIAPVSAQDAMKLPDFIKHTECKVDLKGKTIPIYHFGDLSGPFAFITQPLLAGLSDSIKYFNEHGGVCGATLKSDVGTEYRDTGGKREEAQAAFDNFSNLNPKPHVLLLYASADAELLRKQVADKEIPVLISAGSVAGLYGEDAKTLGWIYATNPLYADQLGSFCKFVSEKKDRFPNPKIGYISWPGAFGEAAYTPETVGYCKSVGVEVLPKPEYFLPTATDITTNVQNLVDAGATILYTNSLASGPKIVAKTVVDLGLEGEVQVAGVNWVLDTSVGLLSRTDIGKNGLPAANGIIGSMPFQWWTERQIPGVAFINEQADANKRRLQDKNIAYLLGWGAVDTYIEMYIQTVNRVGSLEAVTGKEIKATVEGMKYSPLGLYNFDFKGGEIRALPDNRIAQLAFLSKDGKGIAKDGADAFTVDLPDGTKAFIPVVVPLGEFAPAPDLRPGGKDAPKM
jgi:ABC-type branched-subunit amino acid transport system substrate-binding protein